MITDEQLMREDRPVEEVQRALLAKTVIRMVRLQTGQRFTSAGKALEAYAKRQQQKGQER